MKEKKIDGQVKAHSLQPYSSKPYKNKMKKKKKFPNQSNELD